MKIKKIFVLCLLVASLLSTLAVSISAATRDTPTQILPGIPEYEYVFDGSGGGGAEYYFGSVRAYLSYHIKKGNVLAADLVQGAFRASGTDVVAAELFVRVRATHPLTGERKYESRTSEDAGSKGYAFCSLEVPCNIWFAVSETYHQGTVIHKGGDQNNMWIKGTVKE